MRRIALCLFVLAVVGAGVKCGGDSGPPLTADEFAKQGNAICAKGNKEIEANFEEFAKKHNLSEKSQPTEAELSEFSEEILVPTVRKQLSEIRALGIPSGDEGEVEGILSAVEEALEEAEKNPAILAEEEAAAFKKVNKLSREYGGVAR